MPLSKWYQSILTLPLRNYIDVEVDGNLSALIISGSPSKEDLVRAWAYIKSEDAEADGNHEYKLYTTLFKEITLLTITLRTITYLVEILQEVYYKQYADQLNNLLKTNFPFDPKDSDQYFKDLKRCITRSKGFKIDLDLKLIQFKAIQEKNEKQGAKPTREYFQSILITLSDHVKYPVQDNITVFEFRDRVKRFNRYNEMIQQQANARK